MKPELNHDPDADAAYVLLSEKPYDHGSFLDENRRLDYAEDGTLIGVEFLYVSEGADVTRVPGHARIAKLLEEHGIRVVAPA